MHLTRIEQIENFIQNVQGIVNNIVIGNYLPITGGTLTGSLTAPSFNGPLSGNATTATTLQTARTIALSGAATGTATSFNGSANIVIPVTGLNATNLNAGTVPTARLGSGTANSTTVLFGNNTWGTLPLNVDTITRLRGTATGTYTSGDLTLLAGTNITISQSGANFTINSNFTNTTYTAGTGLSLTGTVFGQTITTSGTGTFVSGITQTANGFQITLGTPPNTNTTYTAGTGLTLTGTVFSLPVNITGASSGNYVADVAASATGLTVTKGILPVPSLVTSTTATGVTNVVTTNTNTFLNIVENGASVGSSTQVTGTGSVSVSSNASGLLTINGINTTYTAGNGLTLTGTVFSLPVTVSGSGNYVSDVTQTATGITITKSTLPTYTDTVTRLRGTATGTYTSGDLTLLAGTNVTISQTGSNITINSNFTNTTYTAGNGLTLSGTVFSLPVTVSGSGNYVTNVTQSTSGITVSLGTLPSIPTVNNGTLTLSTSTDLTGSATFTANQAGNTTFTVGLSAGTLSTINLGSTAYGWGNHSGLYLGINSNAVSATKLNTARTIALGNAIASTPTAFDGTSNIVIPVNGISEAFLTWGGKNFSGDYGAIDASINTNLNANRFAFPNPASITVEYSTDGGVTWLDYGLPDSSKISLFSDLDTTVRIGKNTTTQTDTTNFQARIIMNRTAPIYTALNKFILSVSTDGSRGSWCSIDFRLNSDITANNNIWSNRANKVPVGGWSGYNVINIVPTIIGSNANQYGEIMFTFGCTSHPASSLAYLGLQVKRIYGYGGVGWVTPSSMARNGSIFSHDHLMNVTFPNVISAIGGNSNNWNTAFGWGNHAGLYSLLNHTHTFTSLTNKPTTLAGFGITDAGISGAVSNVATGTTDVASATNGNTFINIMQGGVIRESVRFIGAGGISITHNIGGVITVTGTNTTYTGSNGISLSGTTFSPTYGTSANTVAQGNDSRINNGQTAFGWGNHSGLYAPISHTHTFLSNWPDTRGVDTTPNDYNARFEGKGIKQNTVIGLNTTVYGTYTSVVGYRGWTDSSGGRAFEFGFANNGQLLFRAGLSTSWGPWRELYHTGNFANGTTAQYIRGDGSLATFPSGGGTITGVSISTPSGNAIGVSPQNVTAGGANFTISYNGTSSQYINGQGNLVTFPSIPAGTVTSVTYNMVGNSLNLSITNPSTTPNLSFTWGGNSSQYVRGDGTLAVLPTGTAYSAGNGLTLSGTTFSLPVTQSGSGNVVTAVVQNTSGITVTKGTITDTVTAVGINNTNYTTGNVNLIAGSNISLSKSGGNITISASGGGGGGGSNTSREYNKTHTDNNDYDSTTPVVSAISINNIIDVTSYNPMTDNFEHPFTNGNVLEPFALSEIGVVDIHNTGYFIKKGTVYAPGVSGYAAGGRYYFGLKYERTSNGLEGEIGFFDYMDVLNHLDQASQSNYRGFLIIGHPTIHDTLFIDIKQFI